jgi:hypothetical protein
MIPPFNEHGYLPPGIHRATMKEIAERFGQGSELRRDQMESLGWLVDLARRAGVQRLIINGSFVTDALEPNDVDCVLLSVSDFPRDEAAVDEIEEGLPFLHIDFVEREDFDVMVQKVFASDRVFVPKGMIEVIQWS